MCYHIKKERKKEKKDKCSTPLHPPPDLPWLRRRVKLHFPAAWPQHLGVLRGQPGEGGCSLRWWQRWQRHRIAAAVGQCRLSPADWRCATLSGHPAQKEKVTFLKSFFCFFSPTVIDKAPRSNLGLGLHLGSVLEQVSDYVCLPCPGCHVERCLTTLENTQKWLSVGAFHMQ